MRGTRCCEFQHSFWAKLKAGRTWETSDNLATTLQWHFHASTKRAKVGSSAWNILAPLKTNINEDSPVFLAGKSDCDKRTDFTPVGTGVIKAAESTEWSHKRLAHILWQRVNLGSFVQRKSLLGKSEGAFLSLLLSSPLCSAAQCVFWQAILRICASRDCCSVKCCKPQTQRHRQQKDFRCAWTSFLGCFELASPPNTVVSPGTQQGPHRHVTRHLQSLQGCAGPFGVVMPSPVWFQWRGRHIKAFPEVRAHVSVWN